MKFYFLVVLFLFSSLTIINAQSVRDVPQSQQFRLGEGLVRIAEPGEIADTVNVWGDINNPGRYLIARGTSVAELISYARGPSRYTTGETTTDWSEVRLEVSISKFNSESQEEEITNFVYRYNEPVPDGLRNFKLETNSVVSIQVRRRPSFADYVRVIAPVVSTIATTFVIIERLSGR
ncbi:MAG: hypothetical protein WD267_01295 [Balneolales bacterium]